MADQEILAKIDTLDMSEGMKAKMRLVHSNFKGMKFGSPSYTLKGFSLFPLLSLWAFFFNILYYLIKGIWRKAISLLVLNIILTVIFVFLAQQFNAPGMAGFGGIIICCIAMQSAYYDIYRTKVLKQKFWW